MSTAGKVLTVLILLVMLVWIVMLSGVSQLNANYGQKVLREQTELDKVTEAATKANEDYLATTEKARLEQDKTLRDVRSKLEDIAKLERRQSSTIESLTRLKIQQADYEVAAQKAKTNLENREAEKVKDEELLAKKKDEIAKLQALNAEYKANLAQLQDEFKKLLADNEAKLKAPVAKPVSTGREIPSS